MSPYPGTCQDVFTAEIIKELRALKKKINRLEEEVSKKDHDIQDPANNFQVKTTQSHDMTLPKAELVVDTQINKYTKGYVLIKYAEDDIDPVTVDKATLILGGVPETYGLYFKGGMYCVHFGESKTYVVSDPLTLQVFEIGESAVEAGYESDWLSAGAGMFHGNIQEDFNIESRINGYFADGNIHNPEDTLGGLSLKIGASYLSNVADSNTLQGEAQDINGDGNLNDLNDYVHGIAAYLVAEYDKYSFGAQYITGTDDFEAGEMGYAVDHNGVASKTEPSAWNFEFAFRPIQPLQLAAKYEGTNDMFGLYPEHQYGGAVSWELLKYTTLYAEYLHGEFDGDNQNANGLTEDERDLITLQLAVVF